MNLNCPMIYGNINDYYSMTLRETQFSATKGEFCKDWKKM